MYTTPRILRGAVRLVLPVVAVAILTAGCPQTSSIVYFNDDGLETAVRRELGQPLGLLTRADLLRLQTLDARSMGIRSLSGLEFAQNLRWLDLDTNEISDLNPLANLQNLETLNLDSNEVTDLAPLAGLLQLNSLSLFDNQVADIQALVANARAGGLGPGDSIIVDAQTLSERALNTDIPELERLGVAVITAEPSGGE